MKALIAAYSKNRVIGAGGTMPWNIPEELERFKKITTGHVIIMGKLTHKDIGRVLPNRTNIILSSTEQFKGENCYTCSSLTEAFQISGDRDTFIIGGERLFKEAIDIVDTMYITQIYKEYDGDRYFPAFDETKFNIEYSKKINSKIPFRYLIYRRKN